MDGYNPNFSIIKSTASEFVTQSGTVKKAGAETTRLKIGDLKARFHIAAKLVKDAQLAGYQAQQARDSYVTTDFLGQRKFILISVSDEKGHDINILVNVNSISHRLGISKETLLSIGSNKVKSLLIATAKRIDLYEKLAAEHEKKHGAGQVNKELMETATKISDMDLLSFHDVRDATKTGNEREMVVGKLNQKGWSTGSVGQKIGSGTFGVAFSVKFENDERSSAVKQRNERVVFQTSINQMENEFNILNQLAKNGNGWGLQKKVHKVLMLDSAFKGEFCLMGPKYDSDYKTHNEKVKGVKLEDRLFEFHQLLTGLKVLDDENILHGDIKPANIFVNAKAGGRSFVHIGDFGGAVVAKPENYPLSTNATHGYCSAHDLEKLNQLEKDYEKNPEKVKKEIIELKKRMDVFSMGIVLYESYTGKAAFKSTEKGFPSFGGQPKEFEPQALNDLVQSMLDADFTKRPTAGQALEALNKIIDQYPGLKNEMQDSMALLR